MCYFILIIFTICFLFNKATATTLVPNSSISTSLTSNSTSTINITTAGTTTIVSNTALTTNATVISFTTTSTTTAVSYTSTTTSTSTTSSTTTSTTTTTSVFDSPSFWSFDNDTLDSLSIFNGVTVNSPTYIIPGINGYGSALSFNNTNSQYVTVSTYRSLVSRSFTVEMWFYCFALTTADYGLFGQFYAQATDQSLHYIIRNHYLYLAFFGDDLPGSTIIQSNIWYHVAFVYDYPTSTQRIYLNGKSDANRSSSAYQGTSGSIVIGKTEQVPGIPNYFSGYIDRVLLVMRTKNASEILDDATLVTWQSFDNGYYYDSGPLGLTATVVNITSVNGRVNQGINFNSMSSYYQVGGFVLLGVPNNSYSISLWVRPSIVNGSILVHLSTTKDGQGWCVDLMGFSSSGQKIVTGWSAPAQVIGPILPANVWTHVVDTYSTTNGVRLYVNGTLIGTTGPMPHTASGLVDILTLANYIHGIQVTTNGTCNSQSIIPQVYYGSIDEFRVYSRELTTTDIYTLANP